MKRRIFLQVSGASAFVPAAQHGLGQQQQRATAPAAAAGAQGGYLFFNPQEAAFIEAAVVRLIPPDEVGPSALQAGVPTYIDRQLHGAWGAGERLYRSGPWQAGTPMQGYQLPLTPAELYRTALRAIRDDLTKNGGAPFENLQGPQQDAYLTTLQTGDRDLGGVPGKVFFESLLAMTIEGYFCDPAYGGNRDMVGWKWIGYPGDPMRRGDVYYKYIFSGKPYPYEDKPLPMKAAPVGAGRPGGVTTTGQGYVEGGKQ